MGSSKPFIVARLPHLNATRVSHLLLLVLLTIDAAPALAQTDTLQLFTGGQVDMNLRLRSSLLAGPSLQSALSGMTSPAITGPLIVFGNPAALGRLSFQQVIVTLAPTVDVVVTDISSAAERIDEQVEKQVDKILDKFYVPSNVRNSDDLYPTVTATFGKSGTTIASLGAAFMLDDKPDSKWFGRIPRLIDRIGFGYYRPLDLRVSMAATGIRMRIKADQESPETLLLAAMKIDGDIRVTADSWALAGAKRIGKLWIGASAIRTDVRVELRAHQRNDGIVSMAGFESAFNDPKDPWENAFLSRASGGFDGDGWAGKIGATFQPFRALLLGVEYRYQPDITLAADFEMEYHSYPALNINAEEGEDSFDVSKITADAKTRTYAKEFDPASTLELQIPSQFSVGITVPVSLMPTFNYTKYIGELSYRYLVVEDGSEILYSRGLKPESSFLVGINLSGLQIAGGMVKAQDLVVGYKDKDGNPIPPADPLTIPRFSIGFDIMLKDNQTLGILLLGLPEDALRFSLAYTF